MATIIDKLFDNAERNQEDDDRTRLHIDLSVELDAANTAHDGKEDQNDDDDGEDGKNDEDNNADNADGNGNDANVNRTNSNNIIVGTTQRPLKVCLANANKLYFSDINKAARRMMERQDPEVTRFNRQKQIDCKMKFYADVFANLESN